VSPKATKYMLAFFAVAALGFFAATVWSYQDNYGGTKAEATITRCEDTGGPFRRRNVDEIYCYGRWVVDGRRQTGDVFNAKPSDVGKTISVRVHGDRASKPQLWQTIGMAVGGLFMVGTVVLVARESRKPPGPKPRRL